MHGAIGVIDVVLSLSLRVQSNQERWQFVFLLVAESSNLDNFDPWPLIDIPFVFIAHCAVVQ